MLEYINLGNISTILLVLLMAIYRKYISLILWPSANTEKNAFFKRPNPNGKKNEPEETNEEAINIFKERICHDSICIPGDGARRFKSTYSGKSFLKDEHEKQKHLFCSTDVALNNDESCGKFRESDEVFSEVFIKDKAFSTSELLIVTGRIGCGKSTILNNWRIQLSDYYETTKFKGTFISIYIDSREIFNIALQGALNFNDTKIATQFEDALFSAIKTKLSINGHIKQQYNNCNSIFDIVSKAKTTGDRIYIFIDELDVLYYEFCKNATNPYEQVAPSPEIKVFNSILEYIFRLSEIKRYDDHTGVIKIVVAMRTSSYKLFMEITNERNGKNSIDKCQTISLKVGTWNVLAKYLIRKINFITEKESQKITNNELLSNLSYITKNINSIGGKDIDRYLRLSVHGIRHSFKLFNRLLEIDGSGRLFKEVLFNPKILTVFQYTDGSDIYSQTREGVSNLFLVNNDYAKDFVQKNQEANKPPILHPALLKQHLHTYWLKMLMLYYISNKCNTTNNSPNMYVTSNQVIDFFSSTEDSPCVYEKELVNLVLFHLTEVRHGRLITVTSKDRQNIELHPTSRLNTIIEEQLAFSFTYLMVVIEDEWLQIPVCFRDDFKISEPWQRSNYFVKNIVQMSDLEKANYIIYKIKLVTAFRYIVSDYLKVEKHRYSAIFKKFSDEKINLDRTKQGSDSSRLRDEVLSFSSSVIKDDEQITRIRHEFSTLKQWRLKLFLKRSLCQYKIYRGYIYAGILQSTKMLMKKYHRTRDISYINPTSVNKSISLRVDNNY